MSKRTIDRHKRIGALLAALLGSACAFTPPEETHYASRPKVVPVRNLTSFSESLRCMDNLFAAFGVRNVVVTSQGIPDATGEIKTGTKEMLISAISRMSQSSGAFTFVDFDQSQLDVNALQSLVGFTSTFVVPNYYIRGAISQLDEQVISENVGGGISIGDADAGAAVNQVMSMVSVDLNMGDLISRQIIPGTSATNQIAVRRTGKSLDAGGSLDNPSLGLNINVTFNKSEGMHQAVRTLVELGAVETLGKLTQVPYWRCLQIAQTNPAIEQQARDWFAAMPPEKRVRFVQRALKSEGLYNGEITGVFDEGTRDAIGVYQSSNNLVADGRITFELYASLISGDLALGRRPNDEVVPARYSPSAVPSTVPLALTVTTPLGPTPSFRAGDKLALQVRASRDAFTYCYYQDGGRSIARIFPNRFQSNALVPAGADVRIPGPAARFEITLDRPGTREEVVCIAADQELGTRLPDTLKADDLTPLPVRSLGEVVEAFRRVGQSAVVVSRLGFDVN